MNRISECCRAGIGAGRRLEYPDDSYFAISYKVDICESCGKEVDGVVKVTECCGEETCTC